MINKNIDNGYAVKFGKAFSVSRNITQTVHSGIRQNSGYDDGRIRTSLGNLEQCIIVLENGVDVSISLEPQGPFLREGGEYALLYPGSANKFNKPISITRVSDGSRYEINEEDFGKYERGESQYKKDFLILIFLAISSAGFGLLVQLPLFLLVSLFFIMVIIIKGNNKNKVSASKTERALKRGELIDAAISSRNK